MPVRKEYVSSELCYPASKKDHLSRRFGADGPGAGVNNLLVETEDNFLLESGSPNVLLLET